MAKVTPPKVGKKKSNAGQPPIWTDPKVVEKLINEYFKREKRPTLAGLAVALDVSRSTLYNYAEKTEFLDIIKKAREQVEEIYEARLLYEGQPTGVIFALKNMGWADAQNIDHTSKGKALKVGVVSYQPQVKDGK